MHWKKRRYCVVFVYVSVYKNSILWGSSPATTPDRLGEIIDYPERRRK